MAVKTTPTPTPVSDWLIEREPPDPATRLDVPALVRGLLPTLLRRPRARLLAWLTALLSPLSQLNQQLQRYATRQRVVLSYSSQTLMFEKALNDVFDPTARRIFIINSDVLVQPFFLNFLAEGQDAKAVFFQREATRAPRRYLRHKAEYDSQVGFTVHVPAGLLPYAEPALSQYHARLDAFIQRYKLATIQYSKVFF